MRTHTLKFTLEFESEQGIDAEEVRASIFEFIAKEWGDIFDLTLVSLPEKST